MDWNVFFSTVSQTSGAIVGIFSAFLITKIVSNQSAYGQKLSQTSKNLSQSKKLSNESAIRYFEWYGKRKAEDGVCEVRDDIVNTGQLKSSEEYYETIYFSPYEKKSDTLAIIQGVIDALGFDKGFGSSLYTKFSSVPNFNIIDKLNEERELIDELYIRVQHQVDINKNLLSELNSEAESSSLISISIFAVMLLFFAGVIYPLSFLPLEPDSEISLSLSAFWDILFSLKGVFLTLISVIFGGLMLVFYFANKNLLYNQDIKSELEKYSKARNYSVYFENYEVNKSA